MSSSTVTVLTADTAPSRVSPSAGTVAGTSPPDIADGKRYARFPPSKGSHSSHRPGSLAQMKTATVPSSTGSCARNCIAPSQVAHRGQEKPTGTSGIPPVRSPGAVSPVVPS